MNHFANEFSAEDLAHLNGFLQEQGNKFLAQLGENETIFDEKGGLRINDTAKLNRETLKEIGWFITDGLTVMDLAALGVLVQAAGVSGYNTANDLVQSGFSSLQNFLWCMASDHMEAEINTAEYAKKWTKDRISYGGLAFGSTGEEAYDIKMKDDGWRRRLTLSPLTITASVAQDVEGNKI